MVNRLVSVGDDSYLPTSVLVGGANLPAFLLDDALADLLAIAPAPSGGGDDGPALNAFLAANAGKTVALRNGATYVTSESIVVPTRTTLNLNRATIDARTIPAGTALAQRYGIRSDGSLGAQIVVSVALAKWARTVTGIASTAGLAPGDMVLISNDEGSVPGMDLSTRDKAELNTIATVDSGTVVSLTHGTIFDYGTTGLTIRKVNAVDKVTITNGNVLMGGVGSAHNGVQIQYGRDALIERVHVDGAEDAALNLRCVLNGDISKGSARNSTSQSAGPVGLGTTGYGAAVWDASRHIRVDSNYFENNRHHVAGGGIWPPAYVTVSNNDGRKASSAAYDCHEPCFYWDFYKNTAEVATHGFFIRGQYATLDSNHVSDISQEAYAVHAYNSVTEQRGTRLMNNTAERCGYGISVGRASGETVEYVSYDLEVTNNKLLDCGTNPIRVRMVDGAKISGNVINGGLLAGILIEGPTSVLRSKNVTLDSNDVRGSGTHGVHLRNVDDVKGVGGTILNAGENGYYIEDCNRVDIGPKVRNPTRRGIYFTGGGTHVLTGANVSGGVDGLYDAVRADGTSSLNVSGGYFASARYAIHTTTTPKLGVTGAHVSDTVHATKVFEDAGAGYINAGLL